MDGYLHCEPKVLPRADLDQFAVSGGASSVTKNIHATKVDLIRDDKAADAITICDTPGFGDTKGHEMEISNGLGIIHALKRAGSIKPVVVLDHRTMDGARWMPLRKNLSTKKAMMGRETLEFSPFAYIFTRCEGKSQRRIKKQLAGVQKKLPSDPYDILGGNAEDKDSLDALLTDMISKTEPDDVICIDPEEADEAQGTFLALVERKPH